MKFTLKHASMMLPKKKYLNLCTTATSFTQVRESGKTHYDEKSKMPACLQDAWQPLSSQQETVADH